MVAAVEKHAAGAVHDVRDRADDALGQSDGRVARRQRVDAAQPFDAIVVTIGEEIPQNHHPDAGARGLGREHRRQHYGAAEQGGDLQDRAPFPAIAAEKHADEGNGEEENSARNQRHRMKGGLVRHPDVGPPIARAHDRQREERRGDRVGKRARRGHRRFDLARQQRVRIKKEIEREHRADGDAQRNDVPARVQGGIAILVLDQRKGEHGGADTGEELGLRERFRGGCQNETQEVDPDSEAANDRHRHASGLCPRDARGAGGRKQGAQESEPGNVAHALKRARRLKGTISR